MPLHVVPRRDRKLNRHIRGTDSVPLRRGEIVHPLGAPAEHVVLVRSGHLRLVARDERSTRTVHVVGPWEITGEEALITGSRRRYDTVAGEVSSIQRLGPGDVLSVLSKSRVTREAFLFASLEDLAFQRHLSSGSGRLTVGGRVASVLLHLAGRLGEHLGRSVRIPIRLTHEAIGDLAGAHRSSVTTVLNEWLYDQWVDDDTDRIRIDDVPALERLSGITLRNDRGMGSEAP